MSNTLFCSNCGNKINDNETVEHIVTTKCIDGIPVGSTNTCGIKCSKCLGKQSNGRSYKEHLDEVVANNPVLRMCKIAVVVIVLFVIIFIVCH